MSGTLTTTEKVELKDLEEQLAFENAASDIECFARWTKRGKIRWYDVSRCTDKESEGDRRVMRAVRYLELSKRLIRHGLYPALVRFKLTFIKA